MTGLSGQAPDRSRTAPDSSEDQIDLLGKALIAAAAVVASIGEDRLQRPNLSGTHIVNKELLVNLKAALDQATPGLIRDAKHRLLIKEARHGQSSSS